MNPTILLATTLILLAGSAASETQDSTESWQYIQIDDSRQKWGDWAEPDWLRYFGLDEGDVNGDGLPDIVSGRYVYLNPGETLEGSWQRIDVGLNTDGALIIDVDGDAFADVISTSLPDVYWLEAKNKEATEWNYRKIASVKATGHVNGQGFATADVFTGGREEILLAAGDGIYAITIPEDSSAEIWPTVNLVPDASDEGFAVGDMDGDGDLDIAAAKMIKEGEWDVPKILFWWENPGRTKKAPMIHKIHRSEHDIDRIRMADFNGDGQLDIAYSEERHPGPDPDAKLVWLQAPKEPTDPYWQAHLIIRQYSMNNLDVGDIDHDGDPDLVTNEHKGELHQTQWFENDGTGHFKTHLIDTGKEMHLGAQLADFDGDGDLDVYGHAWDSYRFLHLWRNDSH